MTLVTLRAPLALALVSPLAACASQKPSAPAEAAVPPALKPADGEKQAFTWHAIGSQIYECEAGEQGKMAAVTSVQRINTEGGNAPATGCAVAADAGKRIKEGYTFDYVYFVAK